MRARSGVARAAIGAGLFVMLAVPAMGQEGSRVSMEDVVSLETAGGVAVAPDGSAVAYTVRSTDWDENRYDVEIWLARRGQEPFQLTRTADGSSNTPRWSPDGSWIAFLADRGDHQQIHLVSLRGGEAFPLTSSEEGVEDFQWSPDGSRIAYLVTDALDEGREAIAERYGDFAVEDGEGRMSHLWIVDVRTDSGEGEARRLTEGAFDVRSFAWSPDGARIAFEHQPDPGISGFFGSDISVVEVASGRTTALVATDLPEGSPRWSPDGQWILFATSSPDRQAIFYRNSVWARIPATGGQPESLLDDFDEDAGAVRWTSAGIRFVASAGTERRVYALDPDTREVTPVDLGSPMVGAVDFTTDGGHMALTAEDGTGLSEVYLADLSGTAAQVSDPLTSFSRQIQGWPLGTREVITWESEDGTSIEGVLFKPEGFDPARRYPLLVVIHGGPTGISRPQAVYGGVYPVQQWLEKGAVVLMPNYRGSAGYGEAFRSLNVRNLGVGDMWDVMSGVEHLVDAGVADPERMGAMGWSQGGYISAFLTTNTDRFRAISVGAGISDWMTYYVNTDIHPFTRQYLKATPWDDPDIYRKTSPITTIRNASTPTQIQHGEFDRRVPIPNAYELYQGLQDVGVETRLIVYKGFGHGITKPKERLAALWHNWQWFGKHIWGEDIDLPTDDAGAARAVSDEGTKE